MFLTFSNLARTYSVICKTDNALVYFIDYKNFMRLLNPQIRGNFDKWVQSKSAYINDRLKVVSNSENNVKTDRIMLNKINNIVKHPNKTLDPKIQEKIKKIKISSSTNDNLIQTNLRDLRKTKLITEFKEISPSKMAISNYQTLSTTKSDQLFTKTYMVKDKISESFNYKAIFNITRTQGDNYSRNRNGLKSEDSENQEALKTITSTNNLFKTKYGIKNYSKSLVLFLDNELVKRIGHDIKIRSKKLNSIKLTKKLRLSDYMSTMDNTKVGTFNSPFTRNDTSSVYNWTKGDDFKLFDTSNSKYSRFSNV